MALQAVSHAPSRPCFAPSQAKLHQLLGHSAEAAHYYRADLDRLDGQGATGSDVAEALTFLASYHSVRTCCTAAPAALDGVACAAD
jgi:hypothetical protein